MLHPYKPLNILCQNQQKRQSAFAQWRSALNRSSKQNRVNLQQSTGFNDWSGFGDRSKRLITGKIMFRNCLKVAVRNLSKNLFYSLTSIAGLALGLACVFLIIQYLK